MEQVVVAAARIAAAAPDLPADLASLLAHALNAPAAVAA